MSSQGTHCFAVFILIILHFSNGSSFCCLAGLWELWSMCSETWVWNLVLLQSQLCDQRKVSLPNESPYALSKWLQVGPEQQALDWSSGLPATQGGLLEWPPPSSGPASPPVHWKSWGGPFFKVLLNFDLIWIFEDWNEKISVKQLYDWCNNI